MWVWACVYEDMCVYFVSVGRWKGLGAYMCVWVWMVGRMCVIVCYCMRMCVYHSVTVTVCVCSLC